MKKKVTSKSSDGAKTTEILTQLEKMTNEKLTFEKTIKKLEKEMKEK